MPHRTLARSQTAAARTSEDTVEVRAATGSPPGTLVLLVREMRPRQWSKNLILFAGIIFSKNMLNLDLLLRSAVAVVVFCLLSGVVYTVNDLIDLDADRLHAAKRRRPLASGSLAVRTAILWSAFVTAVALAAAFFIGARFLAFSVIFLMFNLAYSVYLKKIVIVDVVSISISFLIRAIAGVVALNTIANRPTISPWLLVVTFFLSLFLGLCKRRHEFLSLTDAAKHRGTLSSYTEELLNQLINMSATATLLAYSIYTIWPETVHHFGTTSLMYTIPIVVVGVTRYMFLVYGRNLGGDPSEMLLTEKSISAAIIAWFCVVAGIIYYAKP